MDSIGVGRMSIEISNSDVYALYEHPIFIIYKCCYGALLKRVLKLKKLLLYCQMIFWYNIGNRTSLLRWLK